jgi:hypothetical protein
MNKASRGNKTIKISGNNKVKEMDFSQFAATHLHYLAQQRLGEELQTNLKYFPVLVC